LSTKLTLLEDSDHGPGADSRPGIAPLHLDQLAAYLPAAFLPAAAASFLYMAAAMVGSLSLVAVLGDFPLRGDEINGAGGQFRPAARRLIFRA